MRPLTLSAPAKINLALRVLRRRPDGYHDLSTVMHTVALADTVTVGPGPDGIRLECSSPDLPAGPDNIACRAAELLARAGGIQPKIRIRLTKHIPVAAGLGGGSSDAAAVLRGLNRWWKLGFSRERLRALAKQLGSDVPFLITGGCALGTGRGDRLVSWPAAKKVWIMLVNPGFPVATADIYRKLKLQLTTKKNYITLLRPALRAENPIKISQNLHNDLEEVTSGLYGAIARMKADLLTCGAVGALMSGSGPTVYGVMPSHSAGQQALAMLRPRYPFVNLTHLTGPFSHSGEAAG